ncbi:response regulator transcription factor [Dietzia timorensis]|uniref:Putative transcriptional regulatory protein YedW n=1 Tax=Dietzia timorensis TaxID=499555 RepID=A0A173LRI2_9ACTN|nr:response regulator transcription factor [Dietzia timorensis]ANI93812.1 putative transcriptional regulatory protein YedW [Dietzia timorensis]
MKSILVVEDDELIRSMLVKALSEAEYTPLEAADGESARAILSSISDIDLVILDIGLPDIDGFELLRVERERGLAAPVIIVTARDSIDDTVEGLESGANDYMSKPFRVPELLARVRLRLKEHDESAGDDSTSIIEHGGLRLDIRTRRVEVDGQIVELTNREFALLELLMRRKGETISRIQLLESVWGMEFDPGSNIVNVYIRSLRRKIGEQKVQTIRGVGYRVG